MATSIDNQWPWKEPVSKVSRGAFIVIEGLDRAGKSTQVKKLCDALYAEGHNVKQAGFPDRTTPMGQMINSYLQSKTEMDDHTIHLLFSANRWEKAKWIEQTLGAGYTIICDRYFYSGMVYSTAKQNPSLSMEWARGPEVGLPEPDRIIFLDLGPEEAANRGGFGEEKYEKKEMQTKVRKLFLGLAGLKDADGRLMKVIDAGRSIDEVTAEVIEDVRARVCDAETTGGLDGGITHVAPWSEDTLSGENKQLRYFHLREQGQEIK